MTTELTKEEQDLVYECVHSGDWAEIFGTVAQIIDDRESTRQLENEQRRMADYLDRQRKSGSVEGYLPECGNEQFHLIHTMAYTDITCFGYCDCKYQAKYPHSTGEHK